MQYAPALLHILMQELNCIEVGLHLETTLLRYGVYQTGSTRLRLQYLLDISSSIQISIRDYTISKHLTKILIHTLIFVAVLYDRNPCASPMIYLLHTHLLQPSRSIFVKER